MKAIFLFVVFMICVRSIFAQHLDMVASGNIWYHYGEYGGWGYHPSQHVHCTYFFKGDTTIGNYTYKKLFLNRRDTLYTNPIYLQNYYGYYAAFRQDSLKVYFILKDSVSERLYADFDLSVGDTLKYYYNESSYAPVVTSIDSVLFGSYYLCIYNLKKGHKFIEGIGNYFGLFHSFSIGIEGDVFLICFFNKGNTYSLDQSRPCIPLISSIEQCSKELNEIQIYPNPVFEGINIKNSNYEIGEVRLYNIYGNLLFSDIIKDNETYLKLTQLPAGIYILKIRNEKSIIEERIIKK